MLGQYFWPTPKIAHAIINPLIIKWIPYYHKFITSNQPLINSPQWIFSLLDIGRSWCRRLPRPIPIIACAPLQELSSQDSPRLNDFPTEDGQFLWSINRIKIKKVCVCENWNWAPAVRPLRIGYRKWCESNRQWCWLLQCIVMAALTKGLPSACILLEKIWKKKSMAATQEVRLPRT